MLGGIAAGAMHPNRSDLGARQGAIAVAAPTLGVTAAVGTSSADLAAVLGAVQSGSPAALEPVLVTYRADLAVLAVAIDRPGANLAGVQTELMSQRDELTRAAQSLSAADRGLVSQVQVQLDGMIASLAGRPHPGSTDHPGQGTGNGNGNGNPGTHGNPSPGSGGGAGNGNGNPGTHGNPSPGPANGGSGGSGSNSGGNGKGHPGSK